jgi:hypothetical protein
MPEVLDIKHPQRLSWSVRLATAAAGIVVLAVFGLAHWLEPDPRGFGTHQQLGLPGCSFRMLTGIACPHCGLTTSFAWLARGDLAASIRANPGGILLAAGMSAVLPWCFLVSCLGRWWPIRDPLPYLIKLAVGFLILNMMLWLMRVIPKMT